MTTTSGKAFFLGDNVDTDQILPGYAMSYPPEKLGSAALAGSSIPDFAGRVRPGDVLFAGENFGCGSSREQAPVALKESGLQAVVAKSFARIFRRNAINIGLPVVVSDEVDRIRFEAADGDLMAVDIEKREVKNVSQNKAYPLVPMARSSLETLRAGGLINRVREKLVARAKAESRRIQGATEA